MTEEEYKLWRWEIARYVLGLKRSSEGGESHR